MVFDDSHFLDIINLKLIVFLAFESTSRLKHLVDIFFLYLRSVSFEFPLRKMNET